jgi:TonB-dependent starch-binding outer membrane protein SusC
LTALVDTPASDVARIEVLKGAAAAAVYGSRGQGGVIVVTTKRGPQPR